MNMYSLQVCLNITSSGLSNHCFSTSYEITVRKLEVVQGLECSADNNMLDITWRQPVNGQAVSYEIRILQYIQPPGSKEVTTSATPFFKEVSNLQVQSSVLQNFVPYAVIVMSLDSARCGEARNITCFTEQGVPTKAPENVMVSHDETDSTVLLVTWDPLTIVEAQGFISYNVLAEPSIGSRKRQDGSLSQSVSGSTSSARLTGANPSLSYDVSVTPVTQSGLTAQGSSIIQFVSPLSSGGIVGGVLTAILIIIVMLLIVTITYWIFRRKKASKFKVNKATESPNAISMDTTYQTPHDVHFYEDIENYHSSTNDKHHEDIENYKSCGNDEAQEITIEACPAYEGVKLHQPQDNADGLEYETVEL